MLASVVFFDRTGDRLRRWRRCWSCQRRGHVEVLQHDRRALEARRPFHDHRVLVELVVDGRHRALAEGVVERVVDRRSNVTPSRAAASRSTSTKVSTPLSASSLSTSVSAVSCAQAVGQLGRPGAQVGQVVALERVLVGGVARAPAHAQVLHRAQEHAQAGQLVELRAQAVDHRLGLARCAATPA